MAKVFKRVGGQKITKVIAVHKDVQQVLEEHALFAAQKAEGKLLLHRKSGDSRIVMEQGDVDHYVVLDDERGLEAALSIEYGRGEIVKDDGTVIPAAAGLFVLHDAFNLPTNDKRPLRGGDSLDE